MNQKQIVKVVQPLVALVLILLVTAWLYWPGTAGPAMLDDRASVTVLNALDEHLEFALDYVFGDRAGPLGRPVSMLSFVLEKLYLDDGIRGGKSVNVVLHLVNACLVIWLYALLLAHIGVPASRYLAVLAGSAWLLSPLFVSTVLYVVQRMAMLATFFMLLACISYIYWRLGMIRGKNAPGYLLLVLIFVILGVFSKETAIVVVPVLLLMECLWFQFLGPDGQVLRRLRFFTLGLIIMGAGFLGAFFALRYNWLVGLYNFRGFSVGERVLTESRILWDYVAQIAMPDVGRMGLYHDDTEISRSLSQPITTLYAIMAWIGVLALSILFLRWRSTRYLVFAVAIFLIGHSTESTILPLELYYEHRNYFPGIGLFLGAAVLFGFLFRAWPEIAAPALVWGGVFVLLLAMRTSSQVQIWSSAPLLYLTQVNGHPGSFRANADMASLLAELGELEAALEYSAKAHKADAYERKGDYAIRDLSLSCTVNEPLAPELIKALGIEDSQRPFSSVSTLNVLVRQLQDNKCPRFDRFMFADRMAEILLHDECCDKQSMGLRLKEKASPNIYAGLAVLENSLERYDNAYQYIERFLYGSPGNIRGLLMKLHFATALQKEGEVVELLALLENLAASGALTLADRQTLSLYKEY